MPAALSAPGSSRSRALVLAGLALAACLASACAPATVQPDAAVTPTGEALVQQEAATRDFLAKKSRLRNVATPCSWPTPNSAARPSPPCSGSSSSPRASTRA